MDRNSVCLLSHIKFRKLLLTEKRVQVNSMGGLHKTLITHLIATGQLATVWGE